MKLLNNKHRIIFEGIVGSQSYGLATPESDVDIKGVYIQTNEEILSNRYIPQIDVDKDTVYYEIRRFLELLSVGNPNVLELLYLPTKCILMSSIEWDFLLGQKEKFLSKKCYNTFSGYAKTQLNKSRGLNKKFNWENKRTERKDIIDFCKTIDRDSGKTYLIKDWLGMHNLTQDQLGLTSIDGFRDCYKLYVDNAGGMYKYKGVGNLETNEPRKSIVWKENNNNWVGIVYFNRESYSSHCKEYKEYRKWLKNRNESRVATNKSHGQDYDSKNLLHVVRLIMTAKEIPLENKINVDRTKDREFLLSIKRGDVDLEQLIVDWTEEANNLKEIYDNSDLKDDVDPEYIIGLELSVRQINFKI